MSANPERDVIDAIDELVNEQLAIGPVDDYNADRYVKCPACGCDWHGTDCTNCVGCYGTSDGELSMTERLHRTTHPAYLPRPPSPRRDINFDLVLDENLQLEWQRNEHPWVVDDPVFRRDPPWMRRSENPQHIDHVCTFGRDGHCVQQAGCASIGPPQRGYTIADLEAMRHVEMRPWAYREMQSYVHHEYATGRFTLPGERRTVRFWQYHHATDQWFMIEGDAEVMRIDWDRNGATVRVRLDPYRNLVVNREDIGPMTPVPVGEHPVGDMIAMEGATTEGFEHVGYLHEDDITFEYTREPEMHAFGGDVVRYAQDRYEVSLEIRDRAREVLEVFNRDV